MANNYNIMADYIVSKYVERVSGKDLPDIFVEDDPAERVMVGMLAEDRIDTTFQGGYTENSSTKFESVPSISFSFVVKKIRARRYSYHSKGIVLLYDPSRL